MVEYNMLCFADDDIRQVLADILATAILPYNKPDRRDAVFNLPHYGLIENATLYENDNLKYVFYQHEPIYFGNEQYHANLIHLNGNTFCYKIMYPDEIDYIPCGYLIRIGDVFHFYYMNTMHEFSKVVLTLEMKYLRQFTTAFRVVSFIHPRIDRNMNDIINGIF